MITIEYTVLAYPTIKCFALISRAGKRTNSWVSLEYFAVTLSGGQPKMY